MYVPGLLEFLDFPDVIALRSPSPLMIQYNEEDEVFTLAGQMDADGKIAEIYSRMGHLENYSGKFYAGQHKFNAAMQEDAFQWLEKRLLKDSDDGRTG